MLGCFCLVVGHVWFWLLFSRLKKKSDFFRVPSFCVYVVFVVWLFLLFLFLLFCCFLLLFVLFFGGVAFGKVLIMAATCGRRSLWQTDYWGTTVTWNTSNNPLRPTTECCVYLSSWTGLRVADESDCFSFVRRQSRVKISCAGVFASFALRHFCFNECTMLPRWNVEFHDVRLWELDESEGKQNNLPS